MSKEFIIFTDSGGRCGIHGRFYQQKIRDKASQKADERANRKRARQGPSEMENLADRYAGNHKP